jgi:phosphoserine / homoserine phosphotransferase
MEMICLDLEGVLVPEIWINVAALTGIEELKATTRDIPDYDKLMQQRLRILSKHKLGLKKIQSVIANMSPLPGAADFLNWLRENFQVTLLSDTFYDFALPLMRQLGYPLLLCHRLKIDNEGMIEDYVLRQKDGKREAVKAFHSLNYSVFAAGDSYNDTSMLSEADAGILFCPPDNVIREFPQFPVTKNYKELREAFIRVSNRNLRY